MVKRSRCQLSRARDIRCFDYPWVHSCSSCARDLSRWSVWRCCLAARMWCFEHRRSARFPPSFRCRTHRLIALSLVEVSQFSAFVVALFRFFSRDNENLHLSSVSSRDHKRFLTNLTLDWNCIALLLVAIKRWCYRDNVLLIAETCLHSEKERTWIEVFYVGSDGKLRINYALAQCCSLPVIYVFRTQFLADSRVCCGNLLVNLWNCFKIGWDIKFN